jgi:hypothetical protein
MSSSTSSWPDLAAELLRRLADHHLLFPSLPTAARLPVAPPCSSPRPRVCGVLWPEAGTTSSGQWHARCRRALERGGSGELRTGASMASSGQGWARRAAPARGGIEARRAPARRARSGAGSRELRAQRTGRRGRRPRAPGHSGRRGRSWPAEVLDGAGGLVLASGGLAGAVLALADGGWAWSTSWPAAEVASGGHGQCGKVGGERECRRGAPASQRKETTCNHFFKRSLNGLTCGALSSSAKKLFLLHISAGNGSHLSISVSIRD